MVDRFEASRLAGEDPDIAARTLWKDIEEGRPVKYEFCVQIMDPDETSALDFDPLDDTKTWPEERFPLIKVGMLILNKNPENFFAQIEQAAFAPANIVPGIEFSADKMLQGRIFSYRDTQRYRVGTNYAQLPVNRPIVPVNNNMSDGSMNCFVPTGDVNYKPNSLDNNCPREAVPLMGHGPCYTGYAVRSPIEKTDDFSQATARYMSLGKEEQDRMAEAMANDLSKVCRPVLMRSLELLENISHELCMAVKKYLQNGMQESSVNAAAPLEQASAAPSTSPQPSRQPARRRQCPGMTRERYMREFKGR